MNIFTEREQVILKNLLGHRWLLSLTDKESSEKIEEISINDLTIEELKSLCNSIDRYLEYREEFARDSIKNGFSIGLDEVDLIPYMGLKTDLKKEIEKRTA